MGAGASSWGLQKLDLEIRGKHRSAPSGRVEKSLVSDAGAYFLTERESSVGVGASPGGLQKLDLDERNASVAQKAAVTQI